MSRGKADEITGLVRIVEMVRDREEAQLAGLMSKVHRIEGERRALKERIRAARIDLGNAQDPAVHASAQRWEVWAMAQLDQLSTEEAKARAAVEDQKLAAAVALGPVSALAEIARNKRREEQRMSERRAQTS
jgi:hypothetical protein